nr:YebC/PmpR family DNA-binding transcriptional regulator [bacterium]
MSGHSKWNNIKRRKGAADAARGKIFTKIGREIAIAVKEGGADPASNARLRDVIAKAKAANMPNDNIQRSIKKASGADEGVQYVANTYEGYGPSGVAVIVETLTDNRNRTISDVRHAFDKSGGSLGAAGSVAWMFDRKGQIVIDRSEHDLDEDTMMMMALDAGADDVVVGEEAYEIITNPSDFSAVREALEGQGLTFITAEIAMIPQNMQIIGDEETARKVRNMLERLEDLDDVQEVYHNADLPEEDEEDD